MANEQAQASGFIFGQKSRTQAALLPSCLGLCFTICMVEPKLRAREATIAMVDVLERSGMLTAFSDLFKTVWSINVARHEPDELGDTSMSLGLQTHQNFITRAERRFRHDDREPDDSHWDLAGLNVIRSGNTFVMSLDGARMAVMKVPFEHGRELRTNQLAKWDGQRHLRAEMAARNTTVLGNRRSGPPSDQPLFELPHAESGVVRDFLLILAGEPKSALTAAWLGVPVLGEDPLIALQSLWWDEEPQVAAAPSRPTPADDVTFEERAVPPLTVTLKSSNTRENQQ